jgi:hypothetical protein
MIECLSASCVLVVVVLATLITARAITIEQAASALGRAFVLLVLALWAVCILKGSLEAALLFLKSFAIWVGILALVLLAITIFVQVIVSTFQKRSPQRGNHERGDL